MTTVDAIQPPASGSTTFGQTGVAATSGDFETFLKMLTVQMENQDPLNPVDSSDYAVQLATFSGVEQQVRTNQLLEALTQGMTSGGIGDAVGWIGKEARAPVAASFDGVPISLTTSTDSAADRAELRVTDAAGQVVDQQAIPLGDRTTLWAGTLPGGGPMLPGQYHFDVVNYKGEEVVSEHPAETYGRVTEVQMRPTGPVAIFAGGEEVPLSDITAIRETAP